MVEQWEEVKHTVTFDLGTGISTAVCSCWCKRCQQVIWMGDSPQVPDYVYKHRCADNGRAAP